MKKVMHKEKANYSIAAYVLGIASIVFGIFEPLPGIIFGIIGLTLARRQNDMLSMKARKFSTIGIIIGVIIVIASLILVSISWGNIFAGFN